MNIRKQLLALSFISGIPLMLVGAMTLYSLWQTSSRDLEKSLEQRTQLASVALERWIEAQHQPVNTLAVYRGQGHELPGRYAEQMVATRPHWVDLRIFDPAWQQLSVWPQDASSLPEELVKGLRTDLERTRHWEIVTDWTQPDGSPFIVIAMPVADGGAIILRARAEALNGVFENVDLSDGAILSVSDQQGRILYHSATSQGIGTDITGSPLFSALGDKRTTILETEGPFDNVQRVYGLAKAGDTGSIVKIGIPSSALYRPAWEQFSRYLIYSALAILAALIGAVIVARRIATPIRQLSKAAHRLGEDGIVLSPDGPKRGEVADLRYAFSFMTERIQEREESLKVLNRQLRELNDLKSEIVSGVSHELRTPLTTIKMLSRLMLHDELSEAERRESLEVIAMECDRQIDLVLNLLDLSRIEAGALYYSLARVDIVDVLKVCERVERHSASAREHELNVSISNELPLVRTDRKAVRRVLCTMIENAIKYTPPGGIVSVRAYHDGNRVAIDVADTGPGIPAEELPCVFDKFFRGGKAHTGHDAEHLDEREAGDYTPEVPGVGLGLYLARTIIEELGGRISVKSKVGIGSTFTIWLPVWQVKAVETAKGANERNVTSIAGG